MSDKRFSSKSLQFSRKDAPRDVAPQPLEVRASDRLHLFNPLVALSHGIHEAVIYQYLSWHCAKFGKWVGTRESLLETFPYITAKEMRLCLLKLRGKVKGYGRLIALKRNGYGCLYTLVKSVKKDSFHAFDPKMAKAYGVLSAVIYDSVLYWITQDSERSGDEPTHYVTPAEWCKIHPYARLRTASRAFQTLMEAGELVIAGRKEGRIPIWTVPLGNGKMDRWYALHKYSRVAGVNKNNEPVTRYVPMLFDADSE